MTHQATLPLITITCAAILWACSTEDKASTLNQEMRKDTLGIEKKKFGNTPDGAADIYRLWNANGMAVSITNYGGIVTELHVPDRNGYSEDIVLGYDSLSSYLTDGSYFGATIGRYANRIAGANFSLDGQDYNLPDNDGGNCLHGGIKGFNRHLWQAREIQGTDHVGMELSRISPHMEEGFPGNLDVVVTYKLNNNNELIIEYHARTDRATIVNLSHHSYFNLQGEGQGDILSHKLMINADSYTPVNKKLIPDSGIASLNDTPLDFREETAIGERIDADFEQLKRAGGYDHNYVLQKEPDTITLAARVYEPGSGRTLEVLTSEPGLQFYSGNFLDGSTIGKDSKPYPKRSGFCLETQHFPDSPNQPDFPSTVLRPGDVYRSTTIYRFSTR